MNPQGVRKRQDPKSRTPLSLSSPGMATTPDRSAGAASIAVAPHPCAGARGLMQGDRTPFEDQAPAFLPTARAPYPMSMSR